jgi:AraC-like DNA-binding protein
MDKTEIVISRVQASKISFEQKKRLVFSIEKGHIHYYHDTNEGENIAISTKTLSGKLLYQTSWGVEKLDNLVGFKVIIPKNRWITIISNPNAEYSLELILSQIVKEMSISKQITITENILKYMVISLTWHSLTIESQRSLGRRSSERINLLINEMSINHIENKTIAYYSNKINVASSYLSELCRKELLISYSDLSKLLMLLRIFNLLTITDKRMNEIADQLSFTDAAHFTKFVKKLLGTTPNKLRQELV